ncbi:hypothetical protein [Isoptericola sp. 178]|uniref:hypothetical protein n=1 Tax=Isoptericola sp. 178 TaxID=3064651 RepID=UPI0027140286|nr:hypothetical protein [Isoptericola sp. 178]MDO8143592.1 hypothetical protein [Isoptericola sp. 178]
MAHLDLDTDDLAAAGRRAHAAAGRLDPAAMADDLTGTGAGAAAGDPALGAAIDDLTAAWGPLRATLAATLEGLGDRLARTAATFDTAEGTTAQRVAAAVTPAPVVRTDGAG